MKRRSTVKKHNNSGKKSEPTSKRAKTRGPMRRDTKEVLAELVGKLKEKLDPKKVAATSGGEERERGELRLCLANWYGESILPVIALRKWTESYFRDAPVAVKRSEPRSTLRWRNSE